MFKKKTIKIISPIAFLIIFAVTNPTYSQHEKKIANICNSSQKSGEMGVSCLALCIGDRRGGLCSVVLGISGSSRRSRRSKSEHKHPANPLIKVPT